MKPLYPGELPRLPEKPDDRLLVKNQFPTLLLFFNDPDKKDTSLYAVNLDSRSSRFNEPYSIYINASGVIECKSVNKPPHTVEIDARNSKFYLTAETFIILEKYREELEKKKTLQEVRDTGKVIRQRFEDL